MECSTTDDDLMMTFKSRLEQMVTDEFTLKAPGFNRNSIIMTLNKPDKKTGRMLHDYSIFIPNGKHDDCVKEVLSTLAERIMTTSKDWTIQLKNIIHSGKRIDFQLDRTPTFAHFIAEILTSSDTYGKPKPSKDRVNIIVADLMYGDGLTLNSLRAILLAEHVRSLLISEGDDCRIHLPGLTAKTREDLLHHGYRLPDSTVHSVQSFITRLDSIEDGRDSNSYRIPISRFFERKKLDEDGYHKSIELLKVDFENDKRLNAIAELESLCKTNEKCIHIIGADHEFQHQKLDLLWRILDGPVNIRDQRHIVFGPVSRRGGDANDSGTRELLEFRTRENRAASEHKYGTAPDNDWTERIQTMTWAGVKFELLTANIRSSVKVDPTETSTEHRSGTFVLYNHARLCNLFNHFDEQVGRGYYPELPEIGAVDFSLLKEEEEWSLLLNYLIPFKSLVATTMQESSGIKATIRTHKVCNFLTRFSRVFSSYYNRCHVLGESRPHLHPKMFARLYLLKAVKQVLHNGLQLLGIEPLRRM